MEGSDWPFKDVRAYLEEQTAKLQAELDRHKFTTRREIDQLREMHDRIFTERQRIFEQNVINRREMTDLLHKQLEAAIASLRREMTVVNEASELAIAKANESLEKRLEGINEWRAQSADRERTQAEDRAQIQATLLPRETFDTWKDSVEQRLNRTAGEYQGGQHERTERRAITAQQIALIGVGLTLVWVVIAVISVVIRLHP